MRLHRWLALVLAIAVIGCLPCVANAEENAAQQLQATIEHIAESVQTATGCAVVLLGKPEFDESSGKWLVAYSASGDGCDQAPKLLLDRGEQVHILFYRKRTLSQVNALAARMIRSVESAFACSFTMRGTRFIETTKKWQIALIASGYDCDAALKELYRQAEPLQVTFSRVPVLDRQLFPRDIPLLP
ncbi:MAG TPA: hypothetical protein VFY39_11720 [Gammaproteobacteria bacterium]|nr:hypothetical protein [Gammaproteobacteria bacterium]